MNVEALLEKIITEFALSMTEEELKETTKENAFRSFIEKQDSISDLLSPEEIEMFINFVVNYDAND